jgi:hypothetical protein
MSLRNFAILWVTLRNSLKELLRKVSLRKRRVTQRIYFKIYTSF